MTRPRTPPPPRQTGPSDPPIGPAPVEPPITPPDPTRELAFDVLDDDLPLALFPVRLEARFLPDADPTEIVIRVFPDEIVADTHDPGLTTAELELARRYWDWIWRAAAEPAAVGEAREWLAGELGPHRAIYVAYASRPEGSPPKLPVPPGKELVPPLKLRTVPMAEAPNPGRARLLPLRWAAFVQGDFTLAGPFWSSQKVDEDLAVSPALVDLPPGSDAKGFLEAQNLGWTYDLALAETAGMVVRIPISALPDMPEDGYHHLIVVGVRSGSDHGAAMSSLLEAHRYTRGLDLLPPGTATNVTDQAPEAAGRLDVQALFESEFSRPEPTGGKPPTGKPPTEPVPKAPTTGLMLSTPAGALELAFGLPADTALDRVQRADDAEPELARAANRALWPATWGSWFTDPMRWAGDGSPLIPTTDISTLRTWFSDFVRADGPLPTLRVGRHPYGILPVSTFEKRKAATVLDHLENVLSDLFAQWANRDAVPLLDPDSSDVVPDERVEELASDVGAIYGATPHIRELRLRPVDDTYTELNDLYSLRIGLVGLMCSAVPTDDGDFATEEELEIHPWHQAFVTREADLRGARGVQGQVDAWIGLKHELADMTGTEAQQAAALAIVKFIDRHEADEGELTGDPLGIIFRHSGRVREGQAYLEQLGAHDELGTDLAPRMYTAGYGEEGTEIPVGVLVAPGDDDDSVADLLKWLGDLHDAVAAWLRGGGRPPYEVTEPYPLLRQLLQVSAARVAPGPPGTALRDGLARLRDLVAAEGAAAIPILERLLRGTLGLSIYRVDAWLTALATDRLASERRTRPSGLQVGAFGWLVNLQPREGKASQGFIHAPSLDHATAAAVLRSGWSAFGTEEGGSPLAVNLSGPRIRAARSLVEGVRSGQELGRILGGRFERILHDRNLDRYIDDVRKAVLRGSGRPNRPATRIVDGLLVARAYTDGIELTQLEQDVFEELDPIVSGDPALAGAVADLVGELDAVADVLFSQAVHALLRGDAGVAAPTLAATGSADSGLPAIDFPETMRGGRLLTQRVVGVLGPTVPGAWPGAETSVLAAAEPRLEGWVGNLLGPPTNVMVDVTGAGKPTRVSLGLLGLGALDAVYGVDELAGRLLEAVGADEGAVIAPGRPADLPDDKLSFDELVSLARAVRALLGRIRPLGDLDLSTDPAVGDSRDAADLATRLDTARQRVPAGDPRLDLLDTHERESPGATPDQLVDRLHILTVAPVPILPVLGAGVPEPLAASFAARRTASAQSQSRIAAWLAQAARVRRDLARFLDAVQLSELASLRTLLPCAFAQSPDDGGPWAGDEAPAGSGAVTAWCNVTGLPSTGPAAGFVVDSWTEVIPAVKATSGIAVHFDRPSAVAPNAVLLAVTRAGESFDINLVRRCVRNALTLAQFRGLGPDEGHAFLSQFIPAAFLPDDVSVLAEESASS